MSESGNITGWWSFLRAVVFRPTIEFVTTGTIFTFLSVATWWRDNFATKEWAEHHALKGFLPHWHPVWWVCIGLVVEILLVVREAYRLWRTEERRANDLELRLEKLAQGDFPKVVLSYVDHDAYDEFSAASASPGSYGTVQNLSPDKSVFNVSVLPFETPNGKVNFLPEIIDHISPGKTVRVQPWVEGVPQTSTVQSHSIGQLLGRCYTDGSFQEYIKEKPFAFRIRYDDGAEGKFEAECALTYSDQDHRVAMGQVTYKRLA